MKLLLALVLFSSAVPAKVATQKYFENRVHYKTDFGNCPARAVGRMTLELVREFEKKQSLLGVKKKIVKDNLKDKYFLSEYEVKYDPLLRTLNFSYDCPQPLMKVQIYKQGGDEFYTAILVDTGELFDPTYEVLLRAEKKIKGDLPHMAYPSSLLGSGDEKKLTSLLNFMGEKFTQNISEVILNENRELTIILSIGRKPSSAFLGKNEWRQKVDKLNSVIEHMQKKQKIPAIINLVNLKKIVVKFSDSI